MDKPIVSVKTLTYNHAPYIKQCIEGVLMQKTDFKFEFVIGEDFSSDGTREICEEYAKNYPDTIKLIISDSNVGARVNSIRTRESCSGKYMAFCEGDDYWTDPYKLQKQVDFLEANSDYDMVHTNCNYFDNNTKMLSRSPFDKSYILKEGFLFNELIKYNRICTLTACVRHNIIKSYIKDVNPDIREWKMGDYPIWLYLSCNSKIKYFDDNTACYRVLKNSASHFNDSSSINKFLFIESGLNIAIYFSKRYDKRNYAKKIISLYKFYILHLRYKNIRHYILSKIFNN